VGLLHVAYFPAISLPFNELNGWNAALLNWGLAMWDRSHLQPLGSKYHMKLLAQAKVIFKEALQFDPNYGPARDALVACTLELKELEEFEEPRKPRY
jgi:hypothetical protein